MKKSVKLLTIIFIVIFLLPLVSYADGRVRFNFRVAGSNSNPELGANCFVLHSGGWIRCYWCRQA